MRELQILEVRCVVLGRAEWLGVALMLGMGHFLRGCPCSKCRCCNQIAPWPLEMGIAWCRRVAWLREYRQLFDQQKSPSLALPAVNNTRSRLDISVLHPVCGVREPTSNT
jgi:hypothetical protein